MAVGLLFPSLALAGLGLVEARKRDEDAGDDGDQIPPSTDAPSTNDSSPSEGDDVAAPFTTFPITRWQGQAGTRSQEYRPADHHGVDLMFERSGPNGSGEPNAMYPAGTANGTKMFFMPENIYVVAVADGTIWSTQLSPRGYCVVLDHGKPFATFYQHLSSLNVPNGIMRGEGKVAVKAGQVLGVVGGDPTDLPQMLKHLHFEIWKDGGAEAHVDPWPYLQDLPSIDIDVHVQDVDS